MCPCVPRRRRLLAAASPAESSCVLSSSSSSSSSSLAAHAPGKGATAAPPGQQHQYCTECSDNPPAKTAHTHASHHQTCSFSHKVQRLSGGTSVTCPSTHHIHPLPSPPFPCFAGTRASGRALHTGPLLHVRTAYTSCTKYVLYESSPPVRIMYARRKCRVFFVPLVRAECNPETRGGESGDTLAQGYFDSAPHVVAPPPPPPIDVGPACWSCTQVSARLSARS